MQSQWCDDAGDTALIEIENGVATHFGVPPFFLMRAMLQASSSTDSVLTLMFGVNGSLTKRNVPSSRSSLPPLSLLSFSFGERFSPRYSPSSSVFESPLDENSSETVRAKVNRTQKQETVTVRLPTTIRGDGRAGRGDMLLCNDPQQYEAMGGQGEETCYCAMTHNNNNWARGRQGEEICYCAMTHNNNSWATGSPGEEICYCALT